VDVLTQWHTNIEFVHQYDQSRRAQFKKPRHFSHRITIVIVAQAQHREHGEFDLAGDLARSSPMEIRSALGLTVRVASRFLVCSVSPSFGCECYLTGYFRRKWVRLPRH